MSTSFRYWCGWNVENESSLTEPNKLRANDSSKDQWLPVVSLWVRVAHFFKSQNGRNGGVGRPGEAGTQLFLCTNISDAVMTSTFGPLQQKAK